MPLYDVENAFRVVQHIIVPESQDVESIHFKPARALSVVFLLRVCAMVPAIDLNDEPAFVTAKSTMKWSIGCCRLKRSPSALRRSRDQSLRSASVMVLRKWRARFLAMIQV
jgi:hypothetical protein